MAEHFAVEFCGSPLFFSLYMQYKNLLCNPQVKMAVSSILYLSYIYFHNLVVVSDMIYCIHTVHTHYISGIVSGIWYRIGCGI